LKVLKLFVSALLVSWAMATSAWAVSLSLNQSVYTVGDTLVLSLNEDWSGSADVYVAVTLPNSDDLLFITPTDFTPSFVPYAEYATASGSQDIVTVPMSAGLPEGEYTVYAAALRSGGFFDMLDDVQTVSFYFDPSFNPEPLPPIKPPEFPEDFRYPDGVTDRVYSFSVESALKPDTGSKPFLFTITSGTLPAGLSLDSRSGLIQGTPTTRSYNEFTIQIADSKGNSTEMTKAIKVYGVLSFGEHGTFKGCNGLQMALNAVQDLDEIRIEQGTYDCVGSVLAENKDLTHGIKISGGWDSSFEQQVIDPTLTVFDAGNQVLADVDTEELCQTASGEWHSGLKRCYQSALVEGRFFTLNNTGTIAVENFSFKNAFSSNSGGALLGQGSVTIDYCVFVGNTVYASSSSSRIERQGGAVYKVSHISNSTFSNNSASSYASAYGSYFAEASAYGGAVSTAGNISNSTFSNNSASSSSSDAYTSSYASASAYGGAVSTAGNISNSTFSNNSASSSSSGDDADAHGGAVSTAGNISNSTFSNNSASSRSSYNAYASGGAVSTASNISNSTFRNNSAFSSSSSLSSYGDANAYGGAMYQINTVFQSNFIDNTVTALGPNGATLRPYGGAIQKVTSIVDSNFSGNTGDFGGAVNNAIYISNSTFTDNSAGNDGGAIYNNSSASAITNSLFSKNTATKGGAISHGTVVNCTVAENTASESGGGFYGKGTILNSIFAQNVAAGELDDIVPRSDLTVDYTLANYISGTFDYGTHNIMGEPRFVDSANGDYRLAADSPAIDLGDSSVLDSYEFQTDAQGNAIDLNDNPRVVGGAIDLGAFERQ